MPERLTLSSDELLKTIRSVLKRLDFTRPVKGDVLEECLTIAQQAPVHVIPCIALPGDRVERQSARVQSALWGSIEQAGRSFMLAARARGLGTTWTCLHLFFEEEAVQLLGHPLCRGRPGSPDPGSLHERHTVQASTSGTPPHDGPLGGLVGQPS